MPEDLKLSQIGSFQLPPPFRGLHSPGVRKHCQITFACYFRKSSIWVKAWGFEGHKPWKTQFSKFFNVTHWKHSTVHVTRCAIGPENILSAEIVQAGAEVNPLFPLEKIHISHVGPSLRLYSNCPRFKAFESWNKTKFTFISTMI